MKAWDATFSADFNIRLEHCIRLSVHHTASNANDMLSNSSIFS